VRVNRSGAKSLEILKHSLLAFLLLHDPPGLWEFLELEKKCLEDLVSGRLNLTPHLSETDRRARAEAVKRYTGIIRALESSNASWVRQQQVENLKLFPPQPPSSTTKGEPNAYGLTYFQSWLAVMSSEPLIQALSSAPQDTPLLVVGSALGSVCGWSAALLNRSTVGIDLVPSMTNNSKSILKESEMSLTFEGDTKVLFHCGDALTGLPGGTKPPFPLIWANDFSWGEQAQRLFEKRALEVLHDEGCMVLYRPPLEEEEWIIVDRCVAPVSWNPTLEFHIVKKANPARTLFGPASLRSLFRG